MTKIVLTSAQEAAFNAAGEVMLELPENISLSYSEGKFRVSGKHDRSAYGYLFASGSTMSLAFDDFATKYAEADKLPHVIKDAAEVKKAALGIVNELRGEGAGDASDSVALDEAADRIAALPVKE
jgi:hypothetical protein